MMSDHLGSVLESNPRDPFCTSAFVCILLSLLSKSTNTDLCPHKYKREMQLKREIGFIFYSRIVEQQSDIIESLDIRISIIYLLY